MKRLETELEATKSSYIGKHEAIFTSGVIAEFSGVHPLTNAKTIKNLFQMISPVAFVDHVKGEQVVESSCYIEVTL